MGTVPCLPTSPPRLAVADSCWDPWGRLTPRDQGLFLTSSGLALDSLFQLVHFLDELDSRIVRYLR
jgi:hypothetical protein